MAPIIHLFSFNTTLACAIKRDNGHIPANTLTDVIFNTFKSRLSGLVNFANTFPEILSTLYEAKYIEKYSKMEEKERVTRKLLPTQNPT